MQIELGKFYKTRDGRKVGPAKHIENRGNYPWNVPDNAGFYGYSNDGVSCIDCDDDDLIAEWTDTPQVGDTGTLEQLGVKAGDVVDLVSSGSGLVDNGKTYTVRTKETYTGNVYSKGDIWAEDDRGFWVSFTCDWIFKLISRADDKPKIWDDMTDAEKGALLLAKHEGKPLQMLIGGDWFDHDGTFAVNVAYRIKPESVVETVVLYGRAVGFFEGRKGITDTHKLTYTTTNGVIDCDSVKMEVL